MKDIYKDPHDWPGARWRKSVQPDGRIIWEPNDIIRADQEHMLFELGTLGVPVEVFAHTTGSLKGSNILKNAQQHARNRYFYTLDLANAYEQVDIEILADQLACLGLAATPEEVYQRLTTYYVPPHGRGLAMGGPASPMLFNFYCLDMDLQLGSYCDPHGITYTRYLDDLTFSSPDRGFATRDVIGIDKRTVIQEIIARNSLAVNHSKTRVMDLANGSVRITGVQLNPGGRLQLKTSYMRAAKRELQDMLITAADIQEVVNYAAGLNGFFNVVAGSTSNLNRDERALYLTIQDILMTYGSPFGRSSVY